MIIRPVLIASVLTLVSSTVFAQNRNINLEPECANTGSGMDPRCVGDTDAGTISDLTTARQERAMERSADGAVPSAPRARAPDVAARSTY